MAGRLRTAVLAAPLDPAEALDAVADPECGAVATFIGAVRQTNQNRLVVAISYDVFDELAETVLGDIVRETAAAIDPRLNAYVAHRKGRLEVGAVSVLIAVSTPHRDEAFRACRRIIEEIKHRAPVWKQEHYADGDSEWVRGHALCQHGPGNDSDPDHAH
jgi:molybdopterin synthase catalytic subunit